MIATVYRRARSAMVELWCDAKAPGGRVASLDGLRALAVAAVLLCHTRLLHGGYVGVEIFFALSGFLITSLLLQEQDRSGRISLGGFYWRRVVRLLPALLAMLAVMAAYDAVRSHSLATPSIRALPAVVFYVGNWVQAAQGADALGLFGHTWTLSVEEQFYFAWPLLLILAARQSVAAVGVAALALFAACEAAGLSCAAHGCDVARWRGTDLAGAGILLGCGLAVLARRFPAHVAAWGRWLWIPAAMALAAAAVAPVEGGLGGWAFALGVNVCACALVAWLSDPRAGKALTWAPLVAAGRISYGVYLWHLPITMALEGHVRGDVALTAAVGVLSLAAALASWALIEQPAQRLRSLFNAPGARRAAASAPA